MLPGLLTLSCHLISTITPSLWPSQQDVIGLPQASLLQFILQLTCRRSTYLTSLFLGFIIPWWLSWSKTTTTKNPACQCRRWKRPGFDPWVRKNPWRRAWQPTPVFLPRKFHGQRSLADYSPWAHEELDMTEHTYMHTHTHTLAHTHTHTHTHLHPDSSPFQTSHRALPGIFFLLGHWKTSIVLKDQVPNLPLGASQEESHGHTSVPSTLFCLQVNSHWKDLASVCIILGELWKVCGSIHLTTLILSTQPGTL